MHLYSESLSARAINSSLIMLDLFPDCFSCGNNFTLSHSLSGSDDNHLVFDSLRDPAMIAGDSSTFIRDLPVVLV